MQQRAQHAQTKQKKVTRKRFDTFLTTTATSENAAFALASMREVTETDDIVSIITNLAYSPAFLLIAEEYRRASHEQIKLGKKYDNGNDFDLRLLCARCFMAGAQSETVAKEVI
jgi:hypothetical protein